MTTPFPDPTKNVLEHVAAAVRRLDDVSALRDELSKERQDNSRREMDLRAQHTAQMAMAEARRIDALRELDRLETKSATEQARLVASTLQNTTEAMAQKLAAIAETIRKELDARVSAVERFQAAGSGRGSGMEKLWALIGGGITSCAGALERTCGGALNDNYDNQGCLERGRDRLVL